MGGYAIDEYEDMDEYEDEDEDEEVSEGEVEEARMPTQEELQFLKRRQYLKEKHRRMLKKESGASLSKSREQKNNLPFDNLSFFGPSQPSIAPRVIQESKSLSENSHLAARGSKTHNNVNSKTVASTHVTSKPKANDQPSEVKNWLKPRSKIQMIKSTRDYTFLLSDDAELPAPSKNLPQSSSFPKSEAQLAQRTPNHAGKVLKGSEERKHMPPVSQMRDKAGPQKPSVASKPNSTSLDCRKHLGNCNENGPGRPSGTSRSSGPARHPGPNEPGRPSASKILPPKMTLARKEKFISASGAKSSVPDVRKPLPSKLPLAVHRQPLEKEHRETVKGKMTTKQPILSSKPQVKQKPTEFSASRSLQREDHPRSRPSLEEEWRRKRPSQEEERPRKRPFQGEEGIRKRPLHEDQTRKRPLQEDRPRKRPMQEDRPRKRPAQRYSDDEDADAAISMIRNMFRYNPRKYCDDDDVSDMEANFDDIMKEERRSAKIARMEDEEELRKIEEEERRERMRKEAKKRNPGR